MCLLAVRVGIVDGRLDQSVADYTTDVALFPSGVAAAEHGMQDNREPSPRALAAMRNITRQESNTA